MLFDPAVTSLETVAAWLIPHLEEAGFLNPDVHELYLNQAAVNWRPGGSCLGLPGEVSLTWNDDPARMGWTVNR